MATERLNKCIVAHYTVDSPEIVLLEIMITLLCHNLVWFSLLYSDARLGDRGLKVQCGLAIVKCMIAYCTILWPHSNNGKNPWVSLEITV
jgi:hypothetical protein